MNSPSLAIIPVLQAAVAAIPLMDYESNLVASKIANERLGAVV
jgi:hypothetical protein